MNVMGDVKQGSQFLCSEDDAVQDYPAKVDIFASASEIGCQRMQAGALEWIE